jgi:hypothetical protein
MATNPAAVTAARRPLAMRWAAVFTGVVLALGFVIATTTLWSALAYSSGIALFADSIGWWNAASTIAGLLIGGLIAGMLCPGGSATGLLHGLAAWGATITGMVILGTPASLATFTLLEVGEPLATGPTSWWPTFVAYGVGMIGAVAGGALGGSLTGSMTPQARGSEEVLDIDQDLYDREVARTRSQGERTMTGRSPR